MGCHEGKVKLEDEIMKAKLERYQIQMERINQLKLLEQLVGKPVKPSTIPDYIAPNIKNKIKNVKEKNNNTSSLTSKKKLPIRVKPKRSKNNIVRRKINLNEERMGKITKKTNKKKGMK